MSCLGQSCKKRSIIGAILFTIVLASCVPAISSVQASPTTSTLPLIPVADSYVDNSNPNVNYGSSIFLYTHNYSESVAEAGAGSNTINAIGPIGNTWLRFDLSQIPSQATVNSIILRMHTAIWGTRSVNRVGVFICNDNSWTESGITWNNAPSPSSATPLQSVVCGDPDMDYDFNLTSALTGKSAVSLVLESVQLAKEPAVFNSKDLSNGPTLIVNYTLPLDIEVIAVVGVGIIVIVIVLGAFVFRLRQKKR